MSLRRRPFTKDDRVAVIALAPAPLPPGMPDESVPNLRPTWLLGVVGGVGDLSRTVYVNFADGSQGRYAPVDYNLLHLDEVPLDERPDLGDDVRNSTIRDRAAAQLVALAEVLGTSGIDLLGPAELAEWITGADLIDPNRATVAARALLGAPGVTR